MTRRWYYSIGISLGLQVAACVSAKASPPPPRAGGQAGASISGPGNNGPNTGANTGANTGSGGSATQANTAWSGTSDQPPPGWTITTVANSGSSPSAAAGSTGTTHSSGQSKKGLGMWGTAGSNGTKVGASWYYNWSPAPYMGDSGSLEFVPMVNGKDHFDDSTFAAIKSSGAKVLLGFNEPDHADQSNMSVDDAIKAWPKFMATGLRLGSPAPASAPNWIDDFMAKAKAQNLRVDFIAVHNYPSFADANAVEHLKGWLTDLHNRYQLPIWLTEFGFCDWATPHLSDEQIKTVIGNVTAMLESLDFVERYAWFSDKAYSGCSQTGVFDGSGQLTTTGQAYSAGGSH